MPYRTRAAEVLELWRETERRLETARGIDERSAIGAEMDRLRIEYQAVVAAARAAEMPEPPAFPGPSPEPAGAD